MMELHGFTKSCASPVEVGETGSDRGHREPFGQGRREFETVYGAAIGIRKNEVVTAARSF
ncbi:hypothetical protein [Streptomyces parvus]|uniref:hypothetical protein n=1 Tax=Streptomyces parvus TaxID=66428 RepID=UPI0035E248B0